MDTRVHRIAPSGYPVYHLSELYQNTDLAVPHAPETTILEQRVN
jgi:hypothetical protein